MAEFLLELLSEEIPARMQKSAAENLERLFIEGLTVAGMPFGETQAHVTPRRLALMVDSLPLEQPDLVEERKGPKVGSPEGAIQGFLKGAGLASLDQAEQRDTGKGVFWFATTRREGRPTEEILEEILGSVLTQFPWPKSMRWSAHKLVWVRPLHNILMVLGGRRINARLEFGPTLSYTGTNQTRGHRFLAHGWFEVQDFAAYNKGLRERFVILDRDERKAEIFGQLEDAAAAEGLKLVMDEKLLDEVTGLVEWPTVLLGSIDAEYMDLPPEVRQVTMRENQRYFTLSHPDGTPAPRFAFVANVPGSKDGGKTIISGNERVLRARLSDARFFWDQDLKATLESRLPALERVTFHAKLGTVRQKAERMAVLARHLSQYLEGHHRDEAETAARLAKCDLVTGMVGEFPELQGLMGGYYAHHEKLGESVALAIADQYKPAGPSDVCPALPVSIAVALADKLDTLAGFFAIDELPTGSRDPYALRRAAIGIFRILRENEVKLPLDAVIEKALMGYADQGTLPAPSPGKVGQIFDFIIDRVKVFLKESGIRPDYIDAALIANDHDLPRIVRRAKALQEFLSTEDGTNLLSAYNRAAKILKDAEPGVADFNQMLVREAEERDLWKVLEPATAEAMTCTKDERFSDGMALLAHLRGPIDAFFDKVLVNDPDEEIRANRLVLLEEFTSTVNAIADFSKIEV